MQPISDRSDIIISIYPNHVKNIVNRTKNHEFRSWKIPDHVKRIWIYETSPVSAIKYMASIGDAKSPEEMMDLKGIGNQEFKNGEKISRYAYEILELYELADPVSLATAKANSWLGGPPQKYVYVRPAVLGELMANLKPPMFKNHHTHSPGPDSDSQEAEAQLQSTFLQFTQFQHPIGNSRIISSPIGSSDTKFNQALDLLSTQQDSYRSAPALPRMSQATTVDLTQPPNLHTQQLLNTTTAVSEPDYISGTQQSLILESSPAHVPSSMPKFPPLRDEGQNVLPDEIPLPFSLASSQLLTYTQMLPASLMNDNVPPPPSFIEDSDMED
jgi:predicted transcriptional regulator